MNAALVNFAAGETSPRSRGRFDLDWFRSSAQKIVNFIPEVPGSARFRTGFRYVCQTRGGVVARQITFQLSSDRGYVLLFTPGKMRVIKDGALLTRAPYDALGTTSLFDAFTDGDYTNNPVWTPYIAARVAVTAGQLVCTAFDPGTGVVGGAARVAQTRNIGTFQFDAEISSDGHVVIFATTYAPTVDANGVTSYTVTGYGINRTGAGNYHFGRFSGSGTFNSLVDLGALGAGIKTFKVVRTSAGLWTVYVGGVLKGSATDVTYTTCAYIAAQAHTTDACTVKLDNVYRPGYGAADNQGAITAVTKASPAVATFSSVGDLANGDEVVIRDVEGMLELNGRQVVLANKSGSTFELTDPVTGDDVDSSAFGAYTTGGRADKVYEIDTPYYAPDLDDLSWAVSARDGVMYISHRKYAPRKLTVDSADVFTLATYSRTNDPFTNSADTLTIVGLDRASTGTLVYFAAGSVLNESATYTFSALVGTTQLNSGTYRLRVPEGNFPTPRAYLITTTGEDEVDSSAWGDYSSGGVATPDVEHPIAVAFYESRLGFFGTPVRPDAIFLSRAPDDDGDPRYDDYTGGTDADFACFFSLAPVNGQIAVITWAAGTDKYLFIGTFGGPHRVSGSGLDEPITPSSINAKQFDFFGCEVMRPAVGARVFWIQRGGVALRTAKYDIAEDGLRSFDMMLNAEQMAESRLQRVILQTGRPDVLWVVREDGVLIGMTVQGDENVAGWHRQKVGGVGAKVLDVQSFSRTDRNDQLWAITERTIDGVTRRFVEYLADDVTFPDLEDFFTDEDSQAADLAVWKNVIWRRQEEYIHLDAAATYNGADRGVAAEATLTPAAVTGSAIAFTASEDVFKASDVGAEIWRKPDRDTGVGAGRGTIVGYTSATQVTVDIDVDFDSVDPIPAGDWYFAVDTIYGLAHLDGETVRIMTDGALADDDDVALGTITLPRAAAVVHVGVGYEGFIKTHNLELATGNGPAQAKPRNIYKAFVRFLNTLGVDFGSDIYDLETLEWRQLNDTFDRPAPVFSGIREIVSKGGWQAAEGKYLIVSQKVPFPCVVQFVDVHFETSEGI